MSMSILSPDRGASAEQLAFRKKEMARANVDASKYVNDAGLEELWAEKAFRHAQVYFKLICSINCTKLKLSKFDDELYQQFLTTFSRVKLDVIDEEKLKTVAAKRRWRNFCSLFEHHVEDYNFGTLLRLDCKEGYSEANTTLVPRVQFLAIEIARNRQGLNMCHFGKDPNPKPTAEEQEEAKEVEEKEEEVGEKVEEKPEGENSEEADPPTA